ncbi:MAG: hypothetical protein WBP54_10300 [Pelodictyon phaeoclathratiforme]
MNDLVFPKFFIGLLWFENDPKKSFETIIKEAADYYKNKYGKDPNMVVVNPDQSPSREDDDPFVVYGVSVKSSVSVLRHHYWIGVSQNK